VTVRTHTALGVVDPETLIGPRSRTAHQSAREVFPDGTSRVTIERDPVPRYVERGDGAYVVDLDGRRLLDLNGNFTTLIHGHGFAPVVEAVARQLRDGSCFANPTRSEFALAELIRQRVPRIERLRFVNTGSEAVMFAIKAARAFTGRSAIAKIEGAYHGSYDWVEVSQSATPANWGSQDTPASTPYYKGMPAAVLDDVVVLRFNDADAACKSLTANAHRLAALILDPMPSRAGLIAPEPAFIAAVHDTCRAHGIVLIADEVLNFRQGYHGASARFGLEPDLFTLGKIIGGGMPIGAIGGRADIMAVFDAAGGPPLVAQGGTFSANPLSMVAGFAAMTALTPAAFDRLDQLGDRLRGRLSDVITERQAPFCLTGAASLFRIHPKRRAPREFRDAFMSPKETAVMKELGRFLAANDILFPVGAAACLSTPMHEAEIDRIVSVFEAFLADRTDAFAGLPDRD
jgi:glutamate-1-semialdehyde 2,1-aminomutase